MKNTNFYNLNIEESLETIESTSTGLTENEAVTRLAKYGKNEFATEKKKNLALMFFSQLNDPMIYILLVAAGISLFLKEFADASIIVAVILLNAIIGLVQEAKAEKSLEALKKMSSPNAMVRRDEGLMEIPASELVPGDIVVLEAGRIVPADIRLTQTVNLKVEESALTGESVPVDKDASFIADGDIGIGDRLNMAYLSTGVSYGRGEGVVVGTGMNTEMGKIAKMLADTKTEMTPLQKKLAGLGKMLGILALIICAALFLLAVIQGRDIFEMLLTAISLAVAAIPEGLPAVVTIVLALGVSRMVHVNTIVRKLPAVETLGSVSIVCSDKTGTLTQNKMTVVKAYLNDSILPISEIIYKKASVFVDGFVLCNDAEVDKDKDLRIGDPTELALIDMGLTLDISKEKLLEGMPRINELAFDSDRKMMTTVHKGNLSEYSDIDTKGIDTIAFTKGAMDNIIKRCEFILEKGKIRPFEEQDAKKIYAAAKELANDALRVLALGFKLNDDSADENGLTFVGLVGMIDPARPEAAGAVLEFKQASVRTIMITGDHRDTAFAIAKDLGIASSEDEIISGDALDKLTQEELNARVMSLRVFARVSPAHKVMIVKAFKSHGHIVSMTGDGVNDAPSLKAADIGVAMGITGTDVSKGAADMVLTDDNFATIKLAIQEGRNIYNNIRETVLFLLSSNLGEILTMFCSIAMGLLSPLKPIHILWINLITDSLPALALGVDEAEKDIMKRPPRSPKDGIFSGGGLAVTIFFGCLIGLMTISAFLYYPILTLVENGMNISIKAIDEVLRNGTTPDGYSVYQKAQTLAFTCLGITQLFNAVGFKKIHKSIFRINHLKNKMMIVAFIVGFGLQIMVTEIPFFNVMFETTGLSVREWFLVTIFCTLPLWMHEIFLLTGRYKA